MLLLPGSVFGPAYDNFIRVGLGGDTHQFEEGMSILLDELLRWRGRYHELHDGSEDRDKGTLHNPSTRQQDKTTLDC